VASTVTQDKGCRCGRRSVAAFPAPRDEAAPRHLFQQSHRFERVRGRKSCCADLFAMFVGSNGENQEKDGPRCMVWRVGTFPCCVRAVLVQPFFDQSENHHRSLAGENNTLRVLRVKRQTRHPPQRGLCSLLFSCDGLFVQQQGVVVPFPT
jgi:hypothetical protein